VKHLFFEGHDTVDLAYKYGTPLYVISENIISRNIKALKQAFEKAGVRYKINFAGKALLNKAICRIINHEGINLDVVSGGEIYTAKTAGFPMEKICFHGSNKTREEMKMAINEAVGVIAIDSEYELSMLHRLTQEMQKKINVLFRISPGVEAHTHELIQTGKLDSKFGLNYDNAKDIILSTKDMPYINVEGIHCHIGSQILDQEPFILAAEKMLFLLSEINKEGMNLTELNLGGGFAIDYLEGDEAFRTEEHIGELCAWIISECTKKGIPVPVIAIEPGRFIVGKAGITLYTVGIVKEIPGVRKYVSVDGGLGDNPRPALYDAEYQAVLANKMNIQEKEIVRISGRCCESDTLIKEAEIAKAEPGDIMAVFATGAYNYSMASNYNRLPRPAMVLLKDDRDELIVKRESYEEIISNDLMPDWLGE
jgi:diaminopimelate decarboxylase